MLTKIALLLLLIIAVFYGGRALTRLGQATTTSTSRRSSEKRASATQLEECPRCGAYVPGGRCNCGQRNDHAG